MDIVLIDTWWNVNCRRQPQQETIPSFNRYMVECELFTRYRPEQTVTVLIDTWWNVNTLLQSLQLQAEQVLIDTWWNVNDQCNLPKSVLAGF